MEVKAPGPLVAFMPDVLATPQLEIQLEHIQKHLDCGGSAVVLRCDGELQTCEANIGHDAFLCGRCRQRFGHGMKWLQGRAEERPFYRLTPAQEAFVTDLAERQWRTAQELCALEVEGADIGKAAFSMLVAMTREASPDFERYQDFVRRSVATAAMVYFSLKAQLQHHRAGAFAVFNARLSTTRPGLRAAQALGVNTDVLEVAGVAQRYSVCRNTLPHDLSLLKRDIEETFAAARLSAAESERILTWFEDRRRGLTRDWPSYTTAQTANLLPPELRRGQMNLVIFRSSEYEFAGVDDWRNPFYSVQNEGISKLVADLGHDGVRVFVRVHPNQADLDNAETKELENLARLHPNLSVIPGGSPVSTYALMDAADAVLTYGSTTGIEAAYAGKISILMGRAEYEDLDVCHRPRSHEELVTLIRKVASGLPPDRPAGLRTGLVKYAHFQQAGGHLHQYARRTGFFTAYMQRGDAREVIEGSTSVE